MKKYISDHIDSIIKGCIAFGIFLVVSFLFLIVVYGFEFRLDYISNSLFVVNVVSLVVSIVLQTGATRLYIGFNYSLKSLINPSKTREEYPSMQDYYDEKAPGHKKNVYYLIVVNAIFVIAALIISELYLQSL